MGLLARILMLVVALACADETRFGVVDVEQAFQRSPLVLVSAHRIKADLGGTGGELKKRGRALAEMRKQLEHGGLELDPRRRAAAEARIAEETTRLVEAQREYRLELEAAQQLRGEELVAQVEEIAREVARKEGVTLLLLKQGRLYRADGTLQEVAIPEAERVDLTEKVARALLAKINPTEIPSATSESSGGS
jgi:Skp family chaperone for outer membrane proteins